MALAMANTTDARSTLRAMLRRSCPNCYAPITEVVLDTRTRSRRVECRRGHRFRLISHIRTGRGDEYRLGDPLPPRPGFHDSRLAA